MSSVDAMLKLLDGVEVEWKTVDEIFLLRNGYTPSKAIAEYWEDGDIPWFRMEDLRANCGILTDSIQHVHKSGVKGKLFSANSIIMATTATIGEHALVIVDYLSNQRFTNFTLKSEIRESLDMKFVYYYFFILDEQAKQSVNMSSFPSVQMSELRKWAFPIPPLAVQSEIVRILDNFTELTAELTAELTTRKKQYNYYRNQLLNFDGSDVEWKTLGEVFIISAGGDAPMSALSDVKTNEFNIPILSNGIGDKSLYGWTDKAKIEKPSLTISARGTIGWTSYRETPFFPIVRLLVLTPKINLHLKYAYYFMKVIENSYKVPPAGIPQLTKPMVNDIKIPIPPIAEQVRIAEILDKFDALTSSITEGLPREIALRQQQLEYYRDLLLNFPKTDPVVA